MRKKKRVLKKKGLPPNPRGAGDRKKCKNCNTPVESGFWCGPCRELSRLLAQIHSQDRPRKTAHKDQRVDEETARRVELHRGRTVLFRDHPDPRFYR